MLFQIPQFIETEDKLVGPLTLKQFLYIGAAGGICFALFFVLNIGVWFAVTVIIGGFAAAAAFVKYNGQPLPKIIVFAFNYYWKPRLYLWQRESEMKTLNVPSFSSESARSKMAEFFGEMPSVKKLWQDLATTKNPIPKREKGSGVIVLAEQKDRYQLLRKTTGEKTVARRVDYK